jgi:hypothetical protein
MVDLIISDACPFSHGWMSSLPKEGSTRLFDPSGGNKKAPSSVEDGA